MHWKRRTPTIRVSIRFAYLDVANRYATRPVKQAVISPSALSLMYPAEAIAGYPREQFIDDLLNEHEAEIRRCFAKGGVHTCPGGDRDSTHSADVDYAELLPSLFQLKVGSFYIALAGEPNRR